MRLAAVMIALATVAAAAAAAATARGEEARPHVTVIGDSVLTAVYWNTEPLAILQRGLAMDMDVGVCRTISGVSCPFEGGTVPTLLDVVRARGTRLGPTVLVEVGYNDPAATFARDVERAVTALLAAGVKRILWANMHLWQQQYAAMNEDLAAAAGRHPELTIVDWAGYSRDHYSWFQGDGVHLVYPGALAMATLFNAALREALSPPLAIAPSPLPTAYVGLPYEARLVARGGSGAYRFGSAAGPLPAGLHLLADGRIYGVPVRRRRTMVTFRVVDAYGTVATRREPFVISSRRVSDTD